MSDPNAGGVLIVAEVSSAGELRLVSFELVTIGRRLAEQTGGALTALVMAPNAAAVAPALGAAGVDRLLTVEAACLAGLPAAAATTALAAAVAETAPAIVLAPGTTAGRDYAPRLAARLGVGSMADCVDLSLDGESLVGVRTVLGGRLQSTVTIAGGPVRIATVRPGSYPRAVGGAAPVVADVLPVTFDAADERVTVRAMAEKPTGATNLEAAEVVVTGGRGLKEPDKFALVEELAGVLGGAVGATRAVVDAGWRPHHEQIGQTGRAVAPRLYVAVGVSGAVQHNVGMQGAAHIVAINRDPDAPIFKLAQFGVVGDLFEVVPALIAELRMSQT